MLEHQKIPKVRFVQDCQHFVHSTMDTEKTNLTIIDFSIVNYKQLKHSRTIHIQVFRQISCQDDHSFLLFHEIKVVHVEVSNTIYFAQYT